MALFWLSAALQGFVRFSFPLARDRLASGQTASGEPAQAAPCDPADPVDQVGVLVGVDLVGKLLIGLAGALVVAALAQEVQDRVLVELHAVCS
jgi:hypothetical protein